MSEKEVGEFCSKMPKTEDEAVPSIQLRKTEVEWTIAPNLMIRSFKQEETTYLYLQQLIEID